MKKKCPHIITKDITCVMKTLEREEFEFLDSVFLFFFVFQFWKFLLTYLILSLARPSVCS